MVLLIQTANQSAYIQAQFTKRWNVMESICGRIWLLDFINLFNKCQTDYFISK